MFGELFQDKLLLSSFLFLSLSALVSMIRTSVQSLLCLMFHLLHFAAVPAVPCGWERSDHALSGADSSALTCILYSLYFPAYIQKIFCVLSYQKQYTVCLASLPCFLQIFHKLASLYRSSTDFHFCFYGCSFLSMTWRQLGNPRQPKELLLCRNCRS